MHAVHIIRPTGHTVAKCKIKVQSTIKVHAVHIIRQTRHTVADECKIKVQSTIKSHAVHMIRPTKHTDTTKTNVQSANYKVHAVHITPTNTHNYINTQYQAKRTKRKATELRGRILA